MIDAKRVEEMKRMEEMAVEGPWKVGRPSPNGVSNVGTEYGLMTAQCHKASTAQFIAESRQFVPDIIAAYEQQAAEIERLQAEVKAMFHAGYAAAKKDQRKLNEKLAEEALK